MDATAATTPVRTTQTATATDGVVHVFTVASGKPRCTTVTGELVRSGRQNLDVVTCGECRANYDARR